MSSCMGQNFQPKLRILQLASMVPCTTVINLQSWPKNDNMPHNQWNYVCILAIRIMGYCVYTVACIPTRMRSLRQCEAARLSQSLSPSQAHLLCQGNELQVCECLFSELRERSLSNRFKQDVPALPQCLSLAFRWGDSDNLQLYPSLSFFWANSDYFVAFFAKVSHRVGRMRESAEEGSLICTQYVRNGGMELRQI